MRGLGGENRTPVSRFGGCRNTIILHREIYGAPEETRTPKIVLLRHTRIPIPSPGQFFGGDGRDRTDDIMLAKHTLPQLSYTPKLNSGGSGRIRTHGTFRYFSFQDCCLKPCSATLPNFFTNMYNYKYFYVQRTYSC